MEITEHVLKALSAVAVHNTDNGITRKHLLVAFSQLKANLDTISRWDAKMKCMLPFSLQSCPKLEWEGGHQPVSGNTIRDTLQEANMQARAHDVVCIALHSCKYTK